MVEWEGAWNIGVGSHLFRMRIAQPLHHPSWQPPIPNQHLHLIHAQVPRAVGGVFAHELEQHGPLGVHHGAVHAAAGVAGAGKVGVHHGGDLGQAQAQFAAALGQGLGAGKAGQAV